MSAATIRFVKGHGTENDFVVLPELPGELDPALVRAICDRRAGVGGDGVLRAQRDGATWFMDYRNADGSVAETCGNGIRVFARYLVEAGLVEPGSFTVATRAGERAVTVPAGGGDITVEMGEPAWLDVAQVTVGAASWKATGVSMGNPHLVVLDAAPIDALDLAAAPAVEPATSYPQGVNVELCEPVGPRGLRLRVHERGVGETRSCGTGACAAAVAAMQAAGERAAYDVDVPGGRLVVQWRADGTVTLSGPAVLVGTGEFDPAFIRSYAG